MFVVRDDTAGSLQWQHNERDGVSHRGLTSPASRLIDQSFIQAQIKGKNQSSAPLAFVRGIHRWPVNFPNKGPVLPSRHVFSWVIGFRGQLFWRLFSCTRQNLAADACLQTSLTCCLLSDSSIKHNVHINICGILFSEKCWKTGTFPYDHFLPFF